MTQKGDFFQKNVESVPDFTSIFSARSPFRQYQVSGWGFRVQGLEFGFRVSGFGFRVSGFGLRVSKVGFRVSKFGFRVSGFGFWISGSGFGLRVRVSDFGFGFRVSKFRFQVSGFGFRVHQVARDRRNLLTRFITDGGLDIPLEIKASGSDICKCFGRIELPQVVSF